MEERLQRLEKRCRLLTFALFGAFVVPWFVAAQNEREKDIRAETVFAKTFATLDSDGKVKGSLLTERGLVTSYVSADLIKAKNVYSTDGYTVLKDNKLSGRWDSDGLVMEAPEYRSLLKAGGLAVASTKDETLVTLVNHLNIETPAIQSPSFSITDAKGEVYVAMDQGGITAQSVIVRENVTVDNDAKESSIEIALFEKSGPSLVLWDKNHKNRIQLGATLFGDEKKPRAAILISDEKGREGARLDDGGNPRAK